MEFGKTAQTIIDVGIVVGFKIVGRNCFLADRPLAHRSRRALGLIGARTAKGRPDAAPLHRRRSFPSR